MQQSYKPESTTQQGYNILNIINMLLWLTKYKDHIDNLLVASNK